MAYRIIWTNIIIIQYIIFDFITKTTIETIDCRTGEGQLRYIEIFGISKFKKQSKRLLINNHDFLTKKSVQLSLELVKTLFANLNERARRLVSGFLSLSLTSREKTKLALFLNIDPKTVKKGENELLYNNRIHNKRCRKDGGGRKTLIQKYNDFNKKLDEIVDDHIAGDPMNSRRWIRTSLSYIKSQLHTNGINASITSIRTYLKKQKVTLKGLVKSLSTKEDVNRDLQFKQINRIKKGFLKSGNPVISIDSKKKEMIGLLHKPGRTWSKDFKLVFDHDFRHLAKEVITPFGVYDLRYNKGYIYCSNGPETSQFIVEMIVKWWSEKGQFLYQNKTKLLILCDAGGANGYRRYGWKIELQERLSSLFGLRVTVCHYPTGASKWNPIEHKLFSFISINMSGQIIDSRETFLNLIKETRTSSGLSIDVSFSEEIYKKGIKYPKEMLSQLNIRLWPILSKWNYTLVP